MKVSERFKMKEKKFKTVILCRSDFTDKEIWKILVRCAKQENCLLEGVSEESEIAFIEVKPVRKA
jgi:hypothetical protein